MPNVCFTKVRDFVNQFKVTQASRIVGRNTKRCRYCHRGIATMMCTGMAMYIGVVLAAMQSCSHGPLAASHNDTMDITTHMDKEAVTTRTGSG